MSKVTISLSRNGSLKIKGPVALLNEEGEELEVREDRPFFLCRCGGSANKPFCDGTHKKIGFTGA